MPSAVGFIGLGTMGKPMAHNVLKAGYPLIVHDIQPAPVSELCEFGAKAANTPKGVAEQSDIVITMLPSSPHVDAVVFGEHGLLQGFKPDAIYIDMSTIEPAVTRRISGMLAERGIRMLDAPVSRGQPAAVAGTLSIMVGGDEATLEACRSLLASMGTDIFYCGPAGCGALMKVVNNLMAAIIFGAVCEGVVMGVKGGLSLAKILEVVPACSGQSFALEKYFPQFAFRGNFQPGFKADLMHKDVGLALATAAALKIPMPLGGLTRELLAMVQGMGLGEADTTALLKVYEQLAGQEVRLPQ
jgi:2-hydroxy-3-oxopropionate reductase